MVCEKAAVDSGEAVHLFHRACIVDRGQIVCIADHGDAGGLHLLIEWFSGGFLHHRVGSIGGDERQHAGHDRSQVQRGEELLHLHAQRQQRLLEVLVRRLNVLVLGVVGVRRRQECHALRPHVRGACHALKRLGKRGVHVLAADVCTVGAIENHGAVYHRSGQDMVHRQAGPAFALLRAAGHHAAGGFESVQSAVGGWNSNRSRAVTAVRHLHKPGRYGRRRAAAGAARAVLERLGVARWAAVDRGLGGGAGAEFRCGGAGEDVQAHVLVAAHQLGIGLPVGVLEQLGARGGWKPLHTKAQVLDGERNAQIGLRLEQASDLVGTEFLYLRVHASGIGKAQFFVHIDHAVDLGIMLLDLAKRVAEHLGGTGLFCGDLSGQFVCILHFLVTPSRFNDSASILSVSTMNFP